MGIDHTASIVWGVEVETPEDCEDRYEWIEELLGDSEFYHFTAGNSMCGETFYAVGIGESVTTRGGSSWERLVEPPPEERARFADWLRSKGLPGEPGWLYGMHVW